MTVKELTREQMLALKQAYLTERLDREENRSPSYGELADADELISDEEVLSAYEGVMFSADDLII